MAFNGMALLLYFPFKEFGEELVLIKVENYGFPFLTVMLLHLWPGQSFLLGTLKKQIQV
jgi:hypothetical protein